MYGSLLSRDKLSRCASRSENATNIRPWRAVRCNSGDKDYESKRHDINLLHHELTTNHRRNFTANTFNREQHTKNTPKPKSNENIQFKPLKPTILVPQPSQKR